MYEAIITFENVVNSYTPQGWTHSKKEFSYKEYRKKFDSFVGCMRYLYSLYNRANVVKAEYINHKTGVRKEWVI